MADLKPQVYKDPRPAEHFTRFHERSRTRAPDWVYTVVRIILTPIALFIYRGAPIQVDNVPRFGPAIVTPNHFSNMDHFFAGVFLRRQVRFMAKSQLFTNPILTFIFTHGGVFPIRRGHRDEEAFITANTILEKGGVVLMYAEGGRSRTGGLGEAKPGVGRLALESGVPVVPVAIHGSQGVRRWRRLRFPKVTIQFGKPMRFEAEEKPSRERQQQVAEEVFAQVRQMYEALERTPRREIVRSLREELRAGGRSPGRSASAS